MTNDVAVKVTLGSVTSILTKPVDIGASTTAAVIMRLLNDADAAEVAASRAVIDSEEALGKGADLVKALSTKIDDANESRLERTRKYDAAKRTIIGLYDLGISRLEVAKTAVSARMRKWQKDEAAKRAEEAAVKQREIDANARARAREQAISGDEAGAKQILTEAAGIVIAPEKVRSTGLYGASAGTRRSRSGAVSDRRLFITALLSRPEPEVGVMLNAVDFPQSALNVLARAVLDGKVKPVDGFTATTDEDLSVR